MNTYKVLVETVDNEVTVEVKTDADLNNCDADMFLSAIEHELEKMGFDRDEIDHIEVI
jgi:hypothetical protein